MKVLKNALFGLFVVLPLMGFYLIFRGFFEKGGDYI